MAALQQIHQAPPDLVLLDLGLPDLGGYEALRMLRAISTGARGRDHRPR